MDFIDHSSEVIAALESGIAQFLEEAGGECESQAKQNSRVRTGKTKGSFDHIVDGETAYVGSSYENAIWEEFGTGEYALEGNGRKGPWKYQDENGTWHTTTGKRGTRALYKAGRIVEGKLSGLAARLIGGRMK